jgi:hypothetical protein
MVRMLVGMTVFFLVASLAQVTVLHLEVLRKPTLDITPVFGPLEPASALTHAQRLEETRLRALVLLESSTLDRHYHQATTLVLSRLWKNYLGFVTGMILALVGAAFVLGKLEGPDSELGAKGEAGELSFKSASPGLMLAVLGVILMVTTVVVHTDITVTNQAIYLRPYESLSPIPADTGIRPTLERPQ